MRTRSISVVGSGKERSQEEVALAESLGAALIREGYAIVCGGTGGVMEAVARGAAAQRKKGRHPPVIGLLPGYDVDSGNKHLDLALPTGMGHARNALVASAGEVVVCVGGAMGALSEVALARKMGRPVIALTPSGGTAKLVGKVLPSVTAAKTVKEVLVRIRELLS